VSKMFVRDNCGHGVEFADIPIRPEQRAPIRFTFFWTNKESREGCDHMVDVES
jgi:hypothetical protein